VKCPAKKQFSAIEAARRLGVGLDYLYGLIWTGKLEGKKVNKRWRIPVDAVESRRKQSRG
jgi:excisionase family DNA binding protein